MSKKTNARMSKKTKKWAIILGIELVLIVILVPLAFLYSKFALVHRAEADEVNKANIVINEDVDVDTQKVLKGYRNIALFGVDTREGKLDGDTRSDSIIIVSINHDTKEIKLLSVYRDTCLYVPGWGYTKATHAYAYGGAELSMSMLNTNFDLDITEFATVDFGVLAKLIDALGGIEIDLSEAEFSLINDLIDEQNWATGSDSPFLDGPGLQLLNGTQATAYARIRKIDSDYMRSERQRIVLTEMFKKAKDANVSQLLKIVDTVLPEVYTNFSNSDMLVLAKDLNNYDLVESSGFPFEKYEGSLDDGLSYVFADGFNNNVIALHEYLFGNSTYSPSPTVDNIGNEIYSKVMR